MSYPTNNKYEFATSSGKWYDSSRLTVSNNRNNSSTQLKKPKLNENFQRPDSSNDSTAANIQSNATRENQTDAAMIGLGSFECLNLFLDLIDKNLMLVCLDESVKSKKSRLAFKGKCSVGLIYGSVEIAGYRISNHELENNQFKWFDLYSPETNAYMAIANRLDDESRISATQMSSQFAEILFQRLVNSSNIPADLIVNQAELMAKLSAFLSDLNPKTSSLLVLRPLESTVCNYISSFDNFHHVYNNTSSNKLEKNLTNESFEVKSIDSLIAEQFGIYPIRSEFLSSILMRRPEEIEIAESLVNNGNRIINWLIFLLLL